MELLNGSREILSQTWILVKKNFILLKRRWPSTLFQAVFPFLMVLTLFGLTQASKLLANNGWADVQSSPASSIPLQCKSWNGQRCYNLVYSAPDSFSQNVISTILSANQWHSGQQALEVEGSQMYQWLLDNQNSTLVALQFSNTTKNVQTGVHTVPYNLYYNATSGADGLDDTASAFQVMLEQTIARVAKAAAGIVGSDPTVDVSFKGMPKPASPFNTLLFVFTLIGPNLFFVAMMLVFIYTIYQISNEKELLLRLGAQFMGLRLSAYWLSWLITGTALVVLFALASIISGLIFQLPFFLNTNFGVLFFVFFCFGFSMFGLAMFLSVFFNKSKPAIIMGVILFIIGFIVNLIVVNPALVVLFYLPASDPRIAQGLAYYPPFNFGKCFFDISQRAMPVLSTATNQYVDGPGYKWSNLYDQLPLSALGALGFDTTLPATYLSLLSMLTDFAIFFFAGWYLDYVFEHKNPFFFLTAHFWGIASAKSIQESITRATTRAAAQQRDPSIDTDVYDEEDRALTQSLDHFNDGSESARAAGERVDESSVVRILKLRKEYSNILSFLGLGKKTLALQDISLVVKEGTCFGLLGHNGAGKTTTISMLVGLFAPTDGDAYIFGKSIRSDMDEIRKTMGVCPQHDILYDDLTAAEHLRLFSELKGVPKHRIDAEVEERLKEVSLLKVKDKPVKTFSGGMKRRCSFAIACIGSPRIIFLDEPTTGMDPASKREVWNMIYKLKGKRVIFLTTHSMEEADALSDRIAIMAFGKIRCLGDSVHLKNRYGAGYNINLMCDPLRQQDLKDYVARNLPGSVLVFENAGSLIYNASPELTAQLPAFLKNVEAEIRNDGGMIKDMGISHTTLEEVYLRVTHHAAFTYQRVQQPAPAIQTVG